MLGRLFPLLRVEVKQCLSGLQLIPATSPRDCYICHNHLEKQLEMDENLTKTFSEPPRLEGCEYLVIWREGPGEKPGLDR